MDILRVGGGQQKGRGLWLGLEAGILMREQDYIFLAAVLCCVMLAVLAVEGGLIGESLRGIHKELHSARVAPQVATLEQTCEVGDE